MRDEPDQPGYPKPVNDSWRGHTFYPPADELDRIPLYDDLGPGDPFIHLHYMASFCDLYVATFDPATGIAYGWAMTGHSDPGMGDWGDMYLPEFEEYRPKLGLGLVERDLRFTPGLSKDVLPSR